MCDVSQRFFLLPGLRAEGTDVQYYTNSLYDKRIEWTCATDMVQELLYSFMCSKYGVVIGGVLHVIAWLNSTERNILVRKRESRYY
jgi:hypothetical protein